MAICQNQLAARHAFPDGPMPVQDRRMTLTITCHEPAAWATPLTGVGNGRLRQGGAVKTFSLCENHAEVYQQIDRELVQDGWAPSINSKPIQLL